MSKVSLLRRRVIVGAALCLPFVHRRAFASEGIVQPVVRDEAGFIGRAFQLRDAAVADGDQPYGALVVRDGVVVGEAASRVVLHNDPTAHAEMEAIRDAARRLGSRNLAGCTLYSSSRACPMCEAAAYWAGIERMVHGRGASDAGAPSLC